METGHFTQLVWKSSVTLGIGKAVIKKDNMKCTFIVARYRPPGNYMGQFQTEVLPGSFSKSQNSFGGIIPWTFSSANGKK